MTDDMQAAAVAAVRAMLATPQGAPNEAWWEAERAARKAVTEAVVAGVSHRAIALQVGCAGLVVAQLVDDNDALAEALVVERAHAERYLDEVREAVRAYAIRRLGPDGKGAQKTTLAAALQVSRPTLDKWVAAAEDE